MLSEYGFKGTFFISGERIGTKDHATWEQLVEMNENGFEIANHNQRHINMAKAFEKNPDCVRDQIRDVEENMKRMGFPHPTTFCYPGFHVNEGVKQLLSEMGYMLARSGCEHVKDFWDFQSGGSGCAYDLNVHSPFQVPCLGVFGDKYSYDEFVEDLETKLPDGQIGIFCIHNVGERINSVDMTVESFEKCVKYLGENDYEVINLRDVTTSSSSSSSASFS
jgi:hypothetical protein